MLLGYQAPVEGCRAHGVLDTKSNTHAQVRRRVPSEHLPLIDAGTNAYTIPLVKPLQLLYHHFPMRQFLILPPARRTWQILSAQN
jgi:hypothetical protein